MSLNSRNNDSDQTGAGGAGDATAGVAVTAAEAGLGGLLLRLSNQADDLQIQLDRLIADVQSNSAQVEALVHHLTDPAPSQALNEQLVELLARMETDQARLDELVQLANALNGAVAKLTRTQFKSTTLAEAKDQQLSSALATFQDIVARRQEMAQASVSQEQTRWGELRSEARGELAVDLLPALDVLELALESGWALLERQRREAADAAAARLSRAEHAHAEGAWQKLRRALGGQPEPGQSALDRGQPATAADEVLDTLEGWLRGLELVHERFLGLFALENIWPIDSEGKPFDPRLHVAMETEARSDVPEGTVVAVLRKGYRQRERVLRYAEVVVSRAPEERQP